MEPVGQSLLQFCYVVKGNKRPATANVALELAGGMLVTVVVIEKEKKGMGPTCTRSEAPRCRQSRAAMDACRRPCIFVVVDGDDEHHSENLLRLHVPLCRAHISAPSLKVWLSWPCITIIV
jgi:hypothetical protein